VFEVAKDISNKMKSADNSGEFSELGLVDHEFNVKDLEDECEVKTDECHEDAKCKYRYGGYDCQCSSGMAGNGFRCKKMYGPEDAVCNFDNNNLCMWKSSGDGGRIQKGSTPSRGTGPLQDVSGEGYYAYMEASHEGTTNVTLSSPVLTCHQNW
jgi:hypothetical protein